MLKIESVHTCIYIYICINCKYMFAKSLKKETVKLKKNDKHTNFFMYALFICSRQQMETLRRKKKMEVN